MTVSTLPYNRRILYVGPDGPGQTSLYRVCTLRRLGQEVAVFDPRPYQPKNRYLAAVAAGYPVGLFIWRVNRDLLRTVRDFRPDVVWFDKPVQFTEATIEAIKRTGARTVCFNQDAPFGPRNDGCWHQFYKVFRLFDLHCLFRNADIPRYNRWRLHWIRLNFSFEPTIHFPPADGWSDAQRTRYASYIGSPHEQRPQFLQTLADRCGIPISISGPRWDAAYSPEVYSRLVTSQYLVDDQYREAIWRSRINLSFITNLNEDDIGHKSVEIAACRGFLLALRTEGHQAMFEEDKEAVFFSHVEECADKCRFYFDRPDLRESVAVRGRERAVRSGYDNDAQLRRVLDRLEEF